MNATILYASDCRACSSMLLSPTRAIKCPRCNSADNCTPPTPIYVSPRVPYRATRKDMDLDEAVSRSLGEDRDSEPRPAAEQTLQSMQKITLTGEYGFVRECGICFEVMIPGDEVVLTSCCHHYTHQECMERALIRLPFCPFCRWCAQS